MIRFEASHSVLHCQNSWIVAAWGVCLLSNFYDIDIQLLGRILRILLAKTVTLTNDYSFISLKHSLVSMMTIRLLIELFNVIFRFLTLNWHMDLMHSYINSGDSGSGFVTFGNVSRNNNFCDVIGEHKCKYFLRHFWLIIIIIWEDALVKLFRYWGDVSLRLIEFKIFPHMTELMKFSHQRWLTNSWVKRIGYTSMVTWPLH